MEQQISNIRASLPSPVRERLNQISRIAGPVLSRTTNYLTEFTEHDLNHSYGVEKMYDLIFKNDFSSLNEDERFILIAATILHDIGMVGNADWMGQEDQLRDSHHSRSRQLINQHRLRLGFNQSEADIIGRIAEAHRKVDFNTLEGSLAFGIAKSIRPRFLAALLRLADELHVTDDRAPEFVTELINPNPLSRMHHERHQVILGVDWSQESANVINIAATVNDWDMEDALHKMVGEIQEKLISVSDILLENQIHIAAIQPQFVLGGVVRKEVLFDLASHPSQCSIDEIQGRLAHRSKTLVKEELNQLYNGGILGVENELLTLRTERKIFTNVFNYLHGTRFELQYIRSPYVIDNIGSILDDIALDVYGTRYLPGEKQDRLLLISNSPTVLDTLLNKQDVHKDFGQLDRAAVLDTIIMGGYLQDVSEMPEIASNSKEGNLAMQAMANSLTKSLGAFVDLLQHMEQAIEEKKN
ncbi:HD domain-containing protein [Cytobacillus firmus]|uniref:HD domain-containing protein n=1 Tax=Cytobacillus firmus TaxID=1399 RepID=UPI00222826C8|nr:HD domain-containing protein [Cytobacillus firmus]